MNANTDTAKKTTTPKTIPKKIMGYLKFAHFVLTSSSDQSDILHTLFLDKSIEQIVALVNDVVVNGQQDKIILDLRKLSTTKPKPLPIPKPKSKPVKPNDADLIVNDLVTLARTTQESNYEIPLETPLKNTKTRIKNTKTPVEKTPETHVEKTPIETHVEKTPIETHVEKTPIETPDTHVEKTPETPVEKTPETPVEKPVEKKQPKKTKAPDDAPVKKTRVKNTNAPAENIPDTPADTPETPPEKTPDTPADTPETSPEKTPIKKTRAKNNTPLKISLASQ